MAPARVIALRGPSSGRHVARGDGAEVAGAVNNCSMRLDPEKRRVVGRGELKFHLALCVDRRSSNWDGHRGEVNKIGALLDPDGQLELAGRRILREQRHRSGISILIAALSGKRPLPRRL